MADISVVIVDDDSLVRRALAAYVSAADGMNVVGEAEDGRAAVDIVVRLVPDVVLMDLRMPEMNGLEATIEITAQHLSSKILASRPSRVPNLCCRCFELEQLATY